MKTALKLAITLAVWSVIACCALALVSSFTTPIIEEQTAAKIKNALVAIFPDVKSYDDIAADLVSPSKTVKFENAYIVKSDSDTIGLAVTATGPTYGSSSIMVGLSLDGTIKTMRFISNTDTKGIGTRVLEPSFTAQFDGKPIDAAFKLGTDVDGISGATISSRGVSKIVKAVCTSGQNYMEAHDLLRTGASSAHSDNTTETDTTEEK